VSLKILLADDSVTAQNMGKKILSDAGFEVVAVSNGSAALKKIPDVKPDLVILDIYMPGYTGLEVCQKIKDSRQTASLPVLLTVGKLEPFKSRDATRVRADGFIVKPFEATELLATIKRIVGVLPEGSGKKSGPDAKSRVKEAKLASQAASAEQLASALRDVLPPEPKFEKRPFEKENEAEQFTGEPGNSREEVAPQLQAAELADQEIEEPQAEPGSAKFQVDFDKHDVPVQRPDDSIPFRASSFEHWEKVNGPAPQDPAAREEALRRIRAARESEAEQQNTEFAVQAGVAEDGESVTAIEDEQPELQEEAEAPAAQAEVQAEEELAPAIEQPAAEVPQELSQTEVAASGAPAVSAPSATTISGLADWAADLHESPTAVSPADTAGSLAPRWIAEEVPLESKDRLSLSDEMQRVQSGGEDTEPAPEPVMEAAPEPQLESAEAYAPAETESDAFEAVAEAAGTPQSEEQVAALAKAAAAAAISSISEIREAVLASAAAAGVSGSISDSVTVQAPEAAVSEAPGEETAPDMSQFTTQPSTPPIDDIQGATIAAVTREVAEVVETTSADLNSDAIASIVNRVIEQMKPKLVAEIAKELTHKPKNE
jgi:CheY-like chemotaxis protein